MQEREGKRLHSSSSVLHVLVTSKTREALIPSCCLNPDKKALVPKASGTIFNI